MLFVQKNVVGEQLRVHAQGIFLARGILLPKPNALSCHEQT